MRTNLEIDTFSHLFMLNKTTQKIRETKKEKQRKTNEKNRKNREEQERKERIHSKQKT